MKKQVKVISIVLMVVMLLCSIANVVLATDLSKTITGIGEGDSKASTAGITNLGKMLVTIIQTIGVVIAIVVLLVLGIKYMMGSAEEKAEYKKTMIPYVVGAVLIFAASTIVNVIYSVANNAASVAVK